MDGTPAIKHHAKQKEAQEATPIERTFWMGVLDVIIYPIGFISVLIALPQAYEVWIIGNVQGVSLLTWSTWTVISVFWMLYASAHRLGALLFINTSWFLMHGLVTIGILVNS